MKHMKKKVKHHKKIYKSTRMTQKLADTTWLKLAQDKSKA